MPDDQRLTLSISRYSSAEAMRAIAEIAAIYNRLQKQGIRLEDLAGAAAS
jgi:hypothetical protein